MLRRRVCRVEEVPEGSVRGFDVEGLSFPVLVTRVGNQIHATASVCPHEDVSLLDGALAGLRLTCRGHGYEFDLDTGRCVHDAALALHRFAVTVVGGEVFVDVVA